mmetsp:Transcript_15319/g.46389  ORF Transcript_15319/g.46389 Transcript_15319/m.46389 type:complete len:276 (-) Transcript_15319:585-1412(-)
MLRSPTHARARGPARELAARRRHDLLRADSRTLREHAETVEQVRRRCRLRDAAGPSHDVQRVQYVAKARDLHAARHVWPEFRRAVPRAGRRAVPLLHGRFRAGVARRRRDRPGHQHEDHAGRRPRLRHSFRICPHRRDVDRQSLGEQPADRREHGQRALRHGRRQRGVPDRRAPRAFARDDAPGLDLRAALPARLVPARQSLGVRLLQDQDQVRQVRLGHGAHGRPDQRRPRQPLQLLHLRRRLHGNRAGRPHRRRARSPRRRRHGPRRCHQSCD